MSSLRRVGALFTLPLLCSLALPAQASAPLINEKYFSQESEDFTDCGMDIHLEATSWGHFMVWEVPGSDGQAFLAHDNYRFRVVLTNTANGEWLLFRGNGLFREASARHVSGDIWEFTAYDSGQQFVVEDSDGNVVLRDRGRLGFRATFDTFGDGQPGGELIEEELIFESGHHPGLDVDFCPLLEELIG